MKVRSRLFGGGAALAAMVTVLAGCSSSETVDEMPDVVTTVVTETATDTTAAPTTSGSDDGDGSSTPPTETITVVAVGRDGQPRDGWTVESGAGGQVNCDPMTPSASAVSDDIYECSPNAAGAHTCWATPASATELLCGTDPWQKTLRQMTSNVALSPVSKPAAPRPWAVELADGVRCTLRHGGAWGGRSDGYLGAYGCDGENNTVLTKGQDVFDESGPQWTVKVGPLGANDEDFPPPETVGVLRAYFAGAQNQS
ncbi:hypothetical protein [Gordonia caeni]|uniref:Uncharacterized protein n=1 Tax=Gordonia caeni TaxID=1007097 RepID=A0ABP7NYX6_9ACTN